MRRSTWTTGVLLACSGLALGAPFAYRVIGEGAPSTFASKIDQAFKTWQDVPNTTLKTIRLEQANTSFAWGADEVPLNPDLASRTVQHSDGSESQSISSEVRINPETSDLESTLLIEAGLRLGLEISPLLAAEKRNLGEADTKALKARYSQSGDLNSDGKINLEDLELLAQNYGKRGSGLAGDLNGDGVVDDADIEILKTAYSFEPVNTAQPTPTTPAPSTPTNPSPADPTPTNPSEPPKG